jgi:hypothetical protein
MCIRDWVWPALERAVERIGTPAGATLDYHFDGAYWVDGLTARWSDPGDPTSMGTFDAVTEGRGLAKVVTVPEAGVASVGQTSPYLMTGLGWLTLPAGVGATAARNAATVTLTNIATATLDLARMGLSTTKPLALTVATDGPATLKLNGVWASAPTVTGALGSSYAGGVLTLTIGASTTLVTITP